jgi:hypothetical protein
MEMTQKAKLMKHGRVQLLDVPCFLAQYQDAQGKDTTRLGFVLGEEVRFLDDKYLSNPAANWLVEDVLCALGVKEPTPPAEEKTNPGSLDRQV